MRPPAIGPAARVVALIPPVHDQTAGPLFITQPLVHPASAEIVGSYRDAHHRASWPTGRWLSRADLDALLEELKARGS